MSRFIAVKWVADEAGEYVFMQTPEGLEMVVQMRGWSYLTKHLTPDEAIEVQKANARLIAAAPKMYELLKVWTQIGVQPTLMNTRKRAKELLDSIDGKETKGACD